MAESARVDWLLRQARLPGAPECVDLALRAGRIVAVGPDLANQAERQVDLEGRLVLPGLVDVHQHLDKAFALEDGVSPGASLDEAIVSFQAWRQAVTPERLYRNARRVAERALLHGTVALRTHVTVDKAGGLAALEALLRLREDMGSGPAIQVVAFPESAEVDSGEALPLLRRALAAGADLIGGAPAKSAEAHRFIDTLLTLAGAEDRDLDLHVDETDDAGTNTLEYLADRVRQTGFPRAVTAGHACSLAAQPEGVARRVIDKVAAAGLHVVTLPYCNLYLMGRADRGLVRRGLTRVRELLAAGVNVAYASDNIRDPFNPFGNANLLQGALVTALALQMGSQGELETVLRMATDNAARIMGLADYGLAPGDVASLIVLDGYDLAGAVAACTPPRFVFVQGRLVAQTRMQSELYDS